MCHCSFHALFYNPKFIHNICVVFFYLLSQLSFPLGFKMYGTYDLLWSFVENTRVTFCKRMFIPKNRILSKRHFSRPYLFILIRIVVRKIAVEIALVTKLRLETIKSTLIRKTRTYFDCSFKLTLYYLLYYYYNMSIVGLLGF